MNLLRRINHAEFRFGIPKTPNVLGNIAQRKSALAQSGNLVHSDPLIRKKAMDEWKSIQAAERSTARQNNYRLY